VGDARRAWQRRGLHVEPTAAGIQPRTARGADTCAMTFAPSAAPPWSENRRACVRRARFTRNDCCRTLSARWMQPICMIAYAIRALWLCSVCPACVCACSRLAVCHAVRACSAMCDAEAVTPAGMMCLWMLLTGFRLGAACLGTQVALCLASSLTAAASRPVLPAVRTRVRACLRAYGRLQAAPER
jgi:hypothetical protein